MRETKIQLAAQLPFDFYLFFLSTFLNAENFSFRNLMRFSTNYFSRFYLQ